jgi:hypothetical protein
MTPIFVSEATRTDATSNVIVGTYGALVGEDVAGIIAGTVCPKEEGTAKVINPAATNSRLIPKPNLGSLQSVIAYALSVSADQNTRLHKLIV